MAEARYRGEVVKLTGGTRSCVWKTASFCAASTRRPW